MADKPYHEMTESELREALVKWTALVDTAGGWASAYFAAKQCAAICKEAWNRDVEMVNPRPIIKGI